jgi:hypothetical protein
MSIGDVIGRETHTVRVSPRTARLNAGGHVAGGSGYWPNLALAREPR